MQFGAPDEDGPKITRETEGEFFQSEMDKAPATERFKDPLVLVAVGWIAAMAIAAIALVAIGIQ